MYDRLQSEMTIGRLRVANRVVMPAMGVNLAAAGGGVTDDIIAFYEARAAGGAGLIITEVTRVAGGAGASDPCQLSACGAADVPGLQRLVDAVHKYDTHTNGVTLTPLGEKVTPWRANSLWLPRR